LLTNLTACSASTAEIRVSVEGAALWSSLSFTRFIHKVCDLRFGIDCEALQITLAEEADDGHVKAPDDVCDVQVRRRSSRLRHASRAQLLYHLSPTPTHRNTCLPDRISSFSSLFSLLRACHGKGWPGTPRKDSLKQRKQRRDYLNKWSHPKRRRYNRHYSRSTKFLALNLFSSGMKIR
jgi:hypothetical protein